MKFQQCADSLGPIFGSPNSYECLGNAAFKYERLGEVSCLSLLGLYIYEQIGDLSALFGIDWIGTN